MKQIIAAMAAMVISASSIAGISLSGKYTGTLNDSSVYTQDLTTTLVGSSAAGAVTVTLDKDFAVDDMYVETTMAGVKFKLGEVDDVTSISAKTTVGIASVGVNQISGGATTFDAGATFSGVKLDVVDITNTTRATTASATVAGFNCLLYTSPSPRD